MILVDVNDRAPEFQPSNLYYARLSEASQPGIVVKQVNNRVSLCPVITGHESFQVHVMFSVPVLSAQLTWKARIFLV